MKLTFSILLLLALRTAGGQEIQPQRGLRVIRIQLTSPRSAHSVFRLGQLGDTETVVQLNRIARVRKIKQPPIASKAAAVAEILK